MDCLLARGLCWAPSRYINQKRYMYADAGNIICRGEGRGGGLVRDSAAQYLLLRQSERT